MSKVPSTGLTQAQTFCLLAMRDGRSPFQIVPSYNPGHWRRGRSVGGATNRMLDRLILDGYATESRQITQKGLKAIESIPSGWHPLKGPAIPGLMVY